jgi:hypothetical protein
MSFATWFVRMTLLLQMTPLRRMQKLALLAVQVLQPQLRVLGS